MAHHRRGRCSDGLKQEKHEADSPAHRLRAAALLGAQPPWAGRTDAFHGLFHLPALSAGRLSGLSAQCHSPPRGTGLAARLGKTVRPPAKTGPAAGVPFGKHPAAGGGCLRHLLHCGPCPEGQRGKLCQPAPQPAGPSGALVEQPGGFSGGPLHSAAGILAQFRRAAKQHHLLSLQVWRGFSQHHHRHHLLHLLSGGQPGACPRLLPLSAGPERDSDRSGEKGWSGLSSQKNGPTGSPTWPA